MQADKSLLLPAPVSEGRRIFLKSGQSPKCQIQGQHLKSRGDRVRQRQTRVTMCHQPRICAKAGETTHQNSSWSSDIIKESVIAHGALREKKKNKTGRKPAWHKRMAQMLRQQHESLVPSTPSKPLHPQNAALLRKVTMQECWVFCTFNLSPGLLQESTLHLLD